MIHISTHQNRGLYREQLKTMHAQRYELFVRTKGWNLTVRDGGEYDEGDDERAVYLLCLDEAGACYGSIRLRPADDFSMVLDKMPHHVAGDVNALRAAPGVWEMARWVNIGGDASAGQEMRIGVIEFLLARGARQCLALPDASMMGYAIRTGWRLEALGPPLPYPEGGIAIAASLPITSEEVRYLRTLTNRTDAFLMEIPSDAVWSSLPLPVIEGAFAQAAADGADPHQMAVRASAWLSRKVDLSAVA